MAKATLCGFFFALRTRFVSVCTNQYGYPARNGFPFRSGPTLSCLIGHEATLSAPFAKVLTFLKDNDFCFGVKSILATTDIDSTARRGP